MGQEGRRARCHYPLDDAGQPTNYPAETAALS